MAEVKIVPNKYASGANDDFVGMRFGARNGEAFVDAFFPHGFKHSNQDNQQALRKELFLLLGAIKRYSSTSMQEFHGAHGHSSDFPFDAYITIIRAFMQYGYYIEHQTKYVHSPVGRINWKRTISSVTPLLQNGSPVYTDFVVRKSEKKTDKLISLVHEWCVFEAFDKLGWIFTTFSPHKPTLSITEENKAFFQTIVRDALRTTNNDKNKLLFNAMIEMLRFERSDNMNSFFLGTTHFHTVWERLVDITYGIPECQKVDYFPPAVWHFIDGRKGGNKLRPDTIMLLSDHSPEIFVLDAKYYSFVWNYSVPAASDINKQITYGEYAKAKKDKTVYNAFIIPYDFEGDPHGLGTTSVDEYAYIGYAVMKDAKGNESHEKVLGILIDTKWLIGNAGKIKKSGLADFIRVSFTKKI